MFGLFKSKQEKISNALIDKAIAGQSFLYKLFLKNLECDESSIRKLEISYFVASIITANYLRIGEKDNNEEILNSFGIGFLQKSLTESGEKISIGTVVKEYQARFSEYHGLLWLCFNPDNSTTGNPTLTLLLHVFECVTNSSAVPYMLKLCEVSGFIQTFVFEHVSFINKLKS